MGFSFSHDTFNKSHLNETKPIDLNKSRSERRILHWCWEKECVFFCAQRPIIWWISNIYVVIFNMLFHLTYRINCRGRYTIILLILLRFFIEKWRWPIKFFLILLLSRYKRNREKFEKTRKNGLEKGKSVTTTGLSSGKRGNIICSVKNT